jgi:hypothetical protein
MVQNSVPQCLGFNDFCVMHVEKRQRRGRNSKAAVKRV